tara:strand:+ start:34939 stop:38778 length:3840 start_codon:yes stop_codon:yes gene_type:complete
VGSRKSNLVVPTQWSNQDRRFGESLKENLDVLLGHRGEPLERAVTFQDLLDAGIVELARGISIFGTTNDLIPKPPPAPNLDVPPAPTNLQASGAFQNIILTWDLQLYVGHSFVEVFRHTSDSVSSATMVAQVSGFTGVYADPVGGGVTRYYWVRAVNENGVRGPFNSSTGVVGTTAPDITALLTLLSNQITSSQLAIDLATPIATIPTLTGTINSLETYTGFASSYSGANLLSRITSSESAVTQINSSITGINTSLGTLNTNISNLQSSVQDVTANVGTVFVQANAPTGSITTNSRWYDSDNNMAPYFWNGSSWVSLQDPRIAANESSITTLNAEVFNANGSSKLATASALNVLDTTVTNINGTLTTVSGDVTSLKNVVFDSSGNSQIATTSALSNLTSQVTSNDGDITTLTADVTTLENEVFNSDGTARLATGSALSALTSTVNTQGNSVSSLQTNVTALQGAVFDGSGAVKLATTSALSGVSSEVSAIYNGDGNPSLITTIQGDVTNLKSSVFDGSGNLQLATGAALTQLNNTVVAIYDSATPGNASVVKSIQDDVTLLNGAVFDGSGAVKLATTTALSGVTQSVEAIYNGAGQPSLVTTLQGDITSLNTVVFNANGTSKVATASALNTLSNNVVQIYDVDNPSNASVVKTISESVTSLQNAVFDSSGNTQLASASAVSLIQNEIYGPVSNPTSATTSRIDSLESTLNDPSSGLGFVAAAVSALETEVGMGNASATRIDNLVSEVFANDGTSRLATAAALSTLNTEVFGSGGASSSRIDGLIAQVFNANGTARLATAEAFENVEAQVFPDGTAQTSSIDSLAAEVFVNGAIGGTPRLATSNALETIQTEVFPNGTSNASRINQLSSAIWSGGNPSNGLVVASADALNTVETEVFPNGIASASSIDTLQVVVEGADGTSGIKGALQQTQTLVSGSGGLTSQFMIKSDLNGYVTGFGFSSSTATGTPESAFIIRADKFAIVNPSNSNQGNTNNPSNNNNRIVPFIVQTAQTTINGVTVPRGVYMDTAFIRNGSIENAKIGDAAIDDAKIANLNASKITAGKINTSRLNIDGATLTSAINNQGVSVLQVNELNANVLTTGLLNSNRINLDGQTIDTDGQGRIIIKDLGVDTLQIAGNAVTIPSSAVLASDQSGFPSSFPAVTNHLASANDVMDLSWTSTGQPTVVFFSINWTGFGNAGGYSATAQLLHTKQFTGGIGTVVEKTISVSGSNNADNIRTVFININPSVGSNTVKLRFANTGSRGGATVLAAGTSIFLLETKK